jgi:predicted secreted protein
MAVLDGTDLILSVGENALGYSTGCKISTSTETGERVTKEAASGKWKEKYVKSFSESISADGVVLVDETGKPTYDELKAMQTAGKPVTVNYAVRDGSSREGKTTGGYTGEYIITSLELDAQAGDDSKYSISLENSGAVTKVGNGLNAATDDTDA